MTYIRLALAIIQLITRIIERRQETTWMNEGARRLVAQQVKEANDALARALRVEEEVRQLSNAERLKRMEAKGWVE